MSLDKAIEAMRKLLEAAIPHLEESEALRRVDEACKGFFAAQRRIDKALAWIERYSVSEEYVENLPSGYRQGENGYQSALSHIRQILAGEKE